MAWQMTFRGGAPPITGEKHGRPAHEGERPGGGESGDAAGIS
jgi:hypothetical protein